MSKQNLKRVGLQSQVKLVNRGKDTSFYVHLEGAPFTPPSAEGFLPYRSVLPFACSRCMYPLHVQTAHTLERGGRTPVLCLGTCLEALRGNQAALTQLGVESLEEVFNACEIPDAVVANAVGYQLVAKKAPENVQNVQDVQKEISEPSAA